MMVLIEIHKKIMHNINKHFTETYNKYDGVSLKNVIEKMWSLNSI